MSKYSNRYLMFKLSSGIKRDDIIKYILKNPNVRVPINMLFINEEEKMRWKSFVETNKCYKYYKYYDDLFVEGFLNGLFGCSLCKIKNNLRKLELKDDAVEFEDVEKRIFYLSCFIYKNKDKRIEAKLLKELEMYYNDGKGGYKKRDFILRSVFIKFSNDVILKYIRNNSVDYDKCYIFLSVIGNKLSNDVIDLWFRERLHFSEKLFGKLGRMDIKEDTPFVEDIFLKCMEYLKFRKSVLNYWKNEEFVYFIMNRINRGDYKYFKSIIEKTNNKKGKLEDISTPECILDKVIDNSCKYNNLFFNMKKSEIVNLIKRYQEDVGYNVVINMFIERNYEECFEELMKNKENAVLIKRMVEYNNNHEKFSTLYPITRYTSNINHLIWESLKKDEEMLRIIAPVFINSPEPVLHGLIRGVHNFNIEDVEKYVGFGFNTELINYFLKVDLEKIVELVNEWNFKFFLEVIFEKFQEKIILNNKNNKNFDKTNKNFDKTNERFDKTNENFDKTNENDQHNERFDKTNERFDKTNEKSDKHNNERFDKTNEKSDKHNERLDKTNEKLDQKYENTIKIKSTEIQRDVLLFFDLLKKNQKIFEKNHRIIASIFNIIFNLNNYEIYKNLPTNLKYVYSLRNKNFINDFIREHGDKDANLQEIYFVFELSNYKNISCKIWEDLVLNFQKTNQIEVNLTEFSNLKNNDQKYEDKAINNQIDSVYSITNTEDRCENDKNLKGYSKVENKKISEKFINDLFRISYTGRNNAKYFFVEYFDQISEFINSNITKEDLNAIISIDNKCLFFEPSRDSCDQIDFYLERIFDKSIFGKITNGTFKRADDVPLSFQLAFLLGLNLSNKYTIFIIFQKIVDILMTEEIKPMKFLILRFVDPDKIGEAEFSKIFGLLVPLLNSSNLRICELSKQFLVKIHVESPEIRNMLPSLIQGFLSKEHFLIFLESFRSCVFNNYLCFNSLNIILQLLFKYIDDSSNEVFEIFSGLNNIIREKDMHVFGPSIFERINLCVFKNNFVIDKALAVVEPYFFYASFDFYRVFFDQIGNSRIANYLVDLLKLRNNPELTIQVLNYILGEVNKPSPNKSIPIDKNNICSIYNKNSIISDSNLIIKTDTKISVTNEIYIKSDNDILKSDNDILKSDNINEHNILKSDNINEHDILKSDNINEHDILKSDNDILKSDNINEHDILKSDNDILKSDNINGHDILKSDNINEHDILKSDNINEHDILKSDNINIKDTSHLIHFIAAACKLPEFSFYIRRFIRMLKDLFLSDNSINRNIAARAFNEILHSDAYSMIHEELKNFVTTSAISEDKHVIISALPLISNNLPLLYILRNDSHYLVKKISTDLWKASVVHPNKTLNCIYEEIIDYGNYVHYDSFKDAFLLTIGELAIKYTEYLERYLSYKFDNINYKSDNVNDNVSYKSNYNIKQSIKDEELVELIILEGLKHNKLHRFAYEFVLRFNSPSVFNKLYNYLNSNSVKDTFFKNKEKNIINQFPEDRLFYYAQHNSELAFILIKKTQNIDLLPYLHNKEKLALLTEINIKENISSEHILEPLINSIESSAESEEIILKSKPICAFLYLSTDRNDFGNMLSIFVKLSNSNIKIDSLIKEKYMKYIIYCSFERITDFPLLIDLLIKQEDKKSFERVIELFACDKIPLEISQDITAFFLKNYLLEQRRDESKIILKKIYKKYDNLGYFKNIIKNTILRS